MPANSTPRENPIAAETHCPCYAMIGTDPVGRITAWNQASEILTGYSASEIVGMPASVLIAEHNSTCIFSTIIGLLSLGETISYREMDWKHKNGRSVKIQISIRPLLSEKGQLTGTLGSFRPFIHQNKHAKTEKGEFPGSTRTDPGLRP